MSIPKKNPSYVLDHPSGYIFRYCILKDLKPIFNKSEFRYSLCTGRIGDAKLRAQMMAGCDYAVDHKVRQEKESCHYDSRQLNDLVKSWFYDMLSGGEIGPYSNFPNKIRSTSSPIVTTCVDSVEENRSSDDTENSYLISEIITEYFAEGGRAGSWSKKSKEEIDKILELFVLLVGNLSIKLYTKEMCAPSSSS